MTLIAPGGLRHKRPSSDPSFNLKAESTSYTADEISRLLVEEKVNVIDDRVIDINRDAQTVQLANGPCMPYDTLVLTMGLQDQTFGGGSIASKNLVSCANKTSGTSVKVDGMVSIDDPYLEE